VTDKEYFELRKELQDSASNLSKAKGAEYTNQHTSKDFDRLFNFKIVAKFLGVSPETTALVYMLKAMLSLASTVKRIEKGAKLSELGGRLTESVKSRIQDVDNYNTLLWALFNDRLKQEKNND